MDLYKEVCVHQQQRTKIVKGNLGFIGLIGYYHKFIQRHDKIDEPQTWITKKDGFKWGNKEHVAFDTLKRHITSALVLSLPDYSHEFVIASDVAYNGLGSFFCSESVHNLAKSLYEKDLMEIALSIQHW